MGQSVTSPMRENLDTLHSHLMRHAGADYDIATATTLTYNQFLSYIRDVNKICANFKDKDGCVLVFAVKKGTDTSVFWKATVRIACVKFNTTNNEVESHRLLNIRQFLQLFRRISYECTEGAIGIPSPRSEAAALSQEASVPPTVAASMILGESSLDIAGSSTIIDGEEIAQEAILQAEGGSKKHNAAVEFLKKDSQSVGAFKKDPESLETFKKDPESLETFKKDSQSLKKENTNLDECVICLERKPDVILPCCHAYCVPCIEQWWEYCENAFEDECLARNIFEQMNVVDKSCPVCRESLSSTQDTWVLPEVPDKSEVSEEIKKSLISFAGSSTSTRNAKMRREKNDDE